jgi:signal transduction histidine kinase
MEQTRLTPQDFPRRFTDMVHEEIQTFPQSLTKLIWQPVILYRLYLGLVSLFGLVIVGWGLLQAPHYARIDHFILLFFLAAVSPFGVTSVRVENSGITYVIGPAVGLAAIPFFGPAAACVILAGFNLCIWLIKPRDQTTWKKSGAQLAFNNGMHALAIVIAAWPLIALREWLGADTVWGQTLPWLPAAVLYEEANLWLLIGVLRLQHGPQIKPLDMWKTDRWASQISIAVLALGGGFLAFAMQEYERMGIVIFYVPIVLSAYAFRLYVRQMQAHMDNLEQIVAERTKDLANLNRQKDAYLAVLTHDMMTPLASIQLCAEELQVDPTAAVDNPHLTTVMLRSQKTLFNLVRNILDIEKLQAGGSLSSQKMACNLGELLSHVVSIVQAEADGRSIALKHRLPAQPVMVFADCQQLERILLNLLANAVKYTPSGGAVYAEVGMARDDAIIKVLDTGYGIPAEELPYIFDRFRRVEQLKDKATGAGLGLAITKALVAEHNGEIIVQSEVGKGSLFTVRLPVGRPDEDDGHWAL